MKRARILAGVLMLSSMLSVPALAGPVESKHLPADAKWYIHLDLEAAKKTVVYQQLLNAVRAQFPLDATLVELKATIGVDPLADINGVTVFNNSFEKDQAALIFYAPVDTKLLFHALAASPDYEETPYGKHTLISWTDANDGKHKNGCFYGNGMILMADKIDTLKMAVDTLNGDKPAGSELVKTQPAGSFFYAAANLGQSPDPNVSRQLSETEPSTFSSSESDGKVKLQLDLPAKGEDQATQLKKMLDGIKAFAEMRAAAAPTAAGVLGQVQVVQEGPKVSVSLQQDSNALLQTLQKMDQEKKALGR